MGLELQEPLLDLLKVGGRLMVDGGLFVGPRNSWDPEMRAERQRLADERLAAFEASQAQ